MKKNGFTLIELLVVVLIIGILAAIAMPNYKRSVNRTRVAQCKILMKSIVDAEKRYYLATDKYAMRFDEMDIETPGVAEGNYNDAGDDKRDFGSYFIALDISPYGGTWFESIRGTLADGYKPFRHNLLSSLSGYGFA